MNVEDGEQEVPDVEFHEDAIKIKNEVTTREVQTLYQKGQSSSMNQNFQANNTNIIGVPTKKNENRTSFMDKISEKFDEIMGESTKMQNSNQGSSN